jgi:hypothetical protein
MCPIFRRLVRPPSRTIETLESHITFSLKASGASDGLQPTTSYVMGKRVRSSFLSIRMVADHPEVGQTSLHKRASQD